MLAAMQSAGGINVDTMSLATLVLYLKRKTFDVTVAPGAKLGRDGAGASGLPTGRGGNGKVNVVLRLASFTFATFLDEWSFTYTVVSSSSSDIVAMP